MLHIHILNQDTREWVEEDYFSTYNILVIGNKARIIFPIPYAAPYFEFSASLEKFETNSPTLDISKKI